MEQGLSRDPFCHLARHFGIFGDASAGQMAKLEREEGILLNDPSKPFTCWVLGKRPSSGHFADSFRGNRPMSVEFGEGVGE